jgi:hypothetical protein
LISPVAGTDDFGDEALNPPTSKVETAFHNADHAIQYVLDLFAA